MRGESTCATINPKARMQKCNSEITGWLKDRAEGKAYEERKKGRGRCPTCHENITANNLKGTFLYESRQQF